MFNRIPVAFFAVLTLAAILILPMTATAATPVFTSDPVLTGFSDEHYEYTVTTDPVSPLGPIRIDQRFAGSDSWSRPGPQEFSQSFTSGLSGNLNKILVYMHHVLNPDTEAWELGTTATLR